jgi:hypothetical protein
VSVLREVAEAAGPALDGHAVADPGEPRFALADPDRAFVLEAVYEGYLMHYGTPRLFVRTDDDLRLLAGDALYALGLSRLAERGDLEAVAELSGLISRSAQAHAEGRGADVEAMWERSARALAQPR